MRYSALRPFIRRGDGRQAFEPPTQIIRENESAAPALYGAKRTGSNRLINGRPTRARDLARFANVVGKAFC
jgi:hypothetical protein